MLNLVEDHIKTVEIIEGRLSLPDFQIEMILISDSRKLNFVWLEARVVKHPVLIELNFRKFW